MKAREEKSSVVKITAAPHVRSDESTTLIMWSVVLSLLPVTAASVWFFGPSALLVIAASVTGCLLTERLFGGQRNSISDGSAMITGLLLGLCLPAGFPLWMAFLGGVFGIGFGKIIFGGLGQNIFNPALLGRAFLQAAFPVAITTWPARTADWWALRGDNFAVPLLTASADAVTGATPLGELKFSDDPVIAPLLDLFLGTTGGSLGETSALLILLGGIYLAIRGHLNWHIPVSILVSVFAFSGLFYLLGLSPFSPGFMLFSGGLMLGAWYMATDMVTSPITDAGCWIFGISIGLLVVIILIWGGLPEGVMYAILLMNALVPFINRATQPRKFGGRDPAAEKEKEPQAGARERDST
jgi:electron transport complex protein RnfD